MELDDLRRSWRQPAATDSAHNLLDASALARLLARGSSNPVGKMRRNVWLEIGFVLFCLIWCLVATFTSHDPFYLAMASWLAIMCVLSGFYFRRKLALLNSLDDASGAMRDTITRQLISLRGLVQIYFQATMWSLPVSLGIGLVFLGGRIIQKLNGQKMWVGLGILLAVYLLAGVLTFLWTRNFTRWYLQRLYGQHLDRLEASLRELEATE
ncbi:hypothetical protein [Hymenobacter sp. BT190]|uniref:hypothetical protein n=1 Tax=Hymenobacter sp. BT190 TaxID=2763505 RepID=UPI0016519678|nr:hypothetical protein [Hymenobacter sp. BT190]MBC6697818.1 hypothetical protein [Hymenobacter sp. BT190]